VNGNKLSALVDRNGLPLACTVLPANVHDSRFYEPTFEAFEIPGTEDQPAIISANAAYNAREIRQYNRNQGIRSNISVNRRNRKKLRSRSSGYGHLLANRMSGSLPGSAAGAPAVLLPIAGDPDDHSEAVDKAGQPKADESVETVYTVAAELEYNPGEAE